MVAMPDHITIKVDEEALKAQVDAVIADALKQAGQRLRWAADDLDPTFWEFQEKNIEAEVERRVKERE